MNEEKKNKETQQVTLQKISKGHLELAQPIRARSQDIEKLSYDFGRLTGWEYVEAMDSDPNARNIFKVTGKQALAVFAAAAAKCSAELDATDIKERIGLADAQRAIQVATLFLVSSAREAGANIYGE